jgi:hypothetical protein
MPVKNVNQHLHKSIPAMLVLIVASLGMILPGVLSELSSLSDQISIETVTSEIGDACKSTPSFPFRLSTHPYDKQHASLPCAVDSANNFLHFRESVRAPPHRYLAHS